MKLTVLCITLLSISATTIANGQKGELAKGKREAEVSYKSSSNHGHSQQAYKSPPFSKGDASAVSIGAGYSIGGAKPTFSYGASGPSESLQSSNHATVQLAPITLHPSNGGVISGDLSQFMRELSHGLNTGAITLSSLQGEPGAQGHSISLSQLPSGTPTHQYQIHEQPESMPQYPTSIKGLGSFSSNGPVLFQPHGHGQPSYSYADPSSGRSFSELSGLTLGSGHSLAGDTGHATVMFLGGSGHSQGGLSFGGSGHSLGDSGYTFTGSGHVPGSLVQSISPSSHSAHGAGYSNGDSGHSLGASSGLSLGGDYAIGGHSLGSSGHSLGGSAHSLHGSAHSLGGSAHSLGGSALSLGGSSHSFGGLGNSLGGSEYSSGVPSLGGSGYGSGSNSLGGSGYASGAHSSGGSGYASGAHSVGESGHSFGGSPKGFGGHYILPSKASFKPSTLLGVYTDSSHGLSSLSRPYGTPSFGSHSGRGQSFNSGGHVANLGASPWQFAHADLPGKSAGFSGLYSVLSSNSHGRPPSPPGTTYGVPQASYSASASHSASSHNPQYALASSKHMLPIHFGKGSSSFKAPTSGLSSLSSHSYSPSHKYVFGGHSSGNVRYTNTGSDDSHGAHSENTYNTIKYSEEMKPSMSQH